MISVWWKLCSISLFKSFYFVKQLIRGFIFYIYEKQYLIQLTRNHRITMYI